MMTQTYDIAVFLHLVIVIVNVRYRKERAVQLGFYPQKEVVYNRLLPYSADIDAESTLWFQDIKANLGKALAVRELRPGLVVWISRLNKYLRLYGFKFPLADHIALIKHLRPSLSGSPPENGDIFKS